MRFPTLTCCALALFVAQAQAAETKTPAPKAATQPAPVEVPAPPPPPDDYNPPSEPAPDVQLPSSATPEPEVTITTKGTEIHEEYRVNGKLYMIKVIPAHGKPYYLIDREGSGEFRHTDLQPNISIPMWVLKRF